MVAFYAGVFVAPFAVRLQTCSNCSRLTTKIYRLFMALSNYPTSQYASEEFVESCGAVLFDLSMKESRICLIHYLAGDEWLLPKGRRNCGEPGQTDTIRTIREEWKLDGFRVAVDQTLFGSWLWGKAIYPQKPFCIGKVKLSRD